MPQLSTNTLVILRSHARWIGGLIPTSVTRSHFLEACAPRWKAGQAFFLVITVKPFAAAVKAAGKPVTFLIGQGYNHFEMFETLGNPYGLLGRAMLEQMKLKTVCA